MGIALGLSAGVCFSMAAVMSRVGMRGRGRDDGVFMSILVNVVVLGSLTATVDLPRWSTEGAVALAVGGVLGTFGGRASNLRAVRLIGPTRAAAFLTAGPLVTAVVGWVVLDEGIGLLSAAGGSLVLGGLLVLVRAQSSALALVPARLEETDHHRPRGYLIAGLAPVFFGVAFVVRKWGLAEYPSVFAGALIGAVAGIVVALTIDAAQGQLPRRIGENLRRVPWWFVGAGTATSAALASQFLAFSYLPAWVISLLQATQVLWTLLLAAVFLRQEERIDRWLIASVALVALGVAAITVQV